MDDRYLRMIGHTFVICRSCAACASGMDWNCVRR